MKPAVNHHKAFARSPEAAQQARLMRFATTASLLVGSGLVIIKAIAWSMTDSLSLFSSLVDSVMDIVASILNFIAIRYALVPPDAEHRFGHGKVEDIAGLAQSMFIVGSALFIFFEGVRRFLHPIHIENENVGMMVMAVSVVATALLIIFQRLVVRRTGSIVVRADALHYLTDLMTNLGVIVALFLATRFNWHWADPLIGFCIAAYILYGAWQIGFHSFHNLMDHEFAPEERQRIISIVKRHPQTIGVHDLKTRRSGMYRFIQMHLVMNETLSLKEAHEIAEEIENEVMKEFPNSDVLIHQDPMPESDRKGSAA